MATDAGFRRRSDPNPLQTFAAATAQDTSVSKSEPPRTTPHSCLREPLPSSKHPKKLGASSCVICLVGPLAVDATPAQKSVTRSLNCIAYNTSFNVLTYLTNLRHRYLLTNFFLTQDQCKASFSLSITFLAYAIISDVHAKISRISI